MFVMRWLKTILRKNRFTSKILESYFFCKFYLSHQGWFESRFQYKPIDYDGKPIPWYTYSFIHFLIQKESYFKQFNIFEYGSGNSTIWWALRVKSVHTVEHSKPYYEEIQKALKLFNNVNCQYVALSEGYADRIFQLEKKFQIIVIDGRQRINCTFNALKCLTNDGVIIWDNSDRVKYNSAYTLLEEKNFKRIDFKGVGPIGHVSWQTTIFYRSNNCFRI